MKKLLTLLLVLLCTTLALSAQNLTVRFDNCTIEEAMTILKNQGVSFMLKSEFLDLTERINADLVDVPLEKVVQTIFGNQNVELIVKGSTVVVSGKAEPVQTKKAAPIVKNVSGSIVDRQGQPVPGASILIQNTNTGTVSDVNGAFSLPLEKDATLVVSCLSYDTKNVKATPGQKLTVVLDESAEFLDEVVLVGYGTQKKVNLTGAVATLSTESIIQRPVENVAQALQGLIPGLNIAQSSGLLDSNPSINIRGIGTIAEGSSAAPLVLIDGTEGNINTINPQDIESISVLKDAASSSIYGALATGQRQHTVPKEAPPVVFDDPPECIAPVIAPEDRNVPIDEGVGGEAEIHERARGEPRDRGRIVRDADGPAFDRRRMTVEKHRRDVAEIRERQHDVRTAGIDDAAVRIPEPEQLGHIRLRFFRDLRPVFYDVDEPPGLSGKAAEAGALLKIAVAERRLEIKDCLLFFQHGRGEGSAPVLLDNPVLSHADIIPKTRLLYKFYCINKLTLHFTLSNHIFRWKNVAHNHIFRWKNEIQLY